MGAMQNNAQSGSKGKGGRGKVRNADRLQAFAAGGDTGHAEWGSCDPKRLQVVIDGITRLGGAITFGLSRDMGAHSITLMLDDNRRSLWFNGDAELDDELDAVISTLAHMD